MLVHEAYLKLVREKERRWENRQHFFRIASMAMRRILVNHAEKRNSQKRGSGVAKELLDEACVMFESKSADLVSIDEALDRLGDLDAERKNSSNSGSSVA